MKLKSIKILGEDFRSLKANQLYEFNTNNYRRDRLSTKVLAGLNGSGKSNLLELLAEIFYYLDLYHLKGSSKEQKLSKNIGFEIEYFFPITLEGRVIKVGDKEWGKRIYDEHSLIRIRKPIDELPEFSFKKTDDSSFTRIDFETEKLLPKRVIAYSSGQNELLSNPFYKIRYHYFEELNKSGAELINNSMFYLSYETNFSIFIANQLLGNKKKLPGLNDIFDIEGLESFRITINLLNYKKNKIDLTEYQSRSIESLKSCATSWIERFESNKTKQHLLIFDFLVTKATIRAFESKFDSPFSLFMAFYELQSLNIHIDPVDHRHLIRTGKKSLNISEEIPKPDPDRLAFRIEKIRVNKKLADGKIKPIYYKQLSDGEHQLNEILGSLLMVEEDGCLFLLDEPDTHFNPKWRAKLIKLFNYLSAKKLNRQNLPEVVRKHEILLTTHSPYVVSDSEKMDVYLFNKTKDGANIKNPESQTYGASIGFLNEEIFGRDNSISEYSNFDLETLKSSVQTLQDIEDAREKLFDFGESIEKFDALRFLREKQQELESKK
jgi:restriction system-associated AAA family ATPase